MSAPPEIIQDVRRWIEKAENDRRNAEFVLTLENKCPTDTVCFHCQQCLEKYLKAVLVFRQIQFPRTHDLVLLANLIGDSSILESIDHLRRLNRYSVEARYPGEWEPISYEEAKAAYQAAVQVSKFAKTLLPNID